jgi:hypothetical protein
LHPNGPIFELAISARRIYQYSAGDVIALDARFAVFAALDSGQLLASTMNCSIFQRRPQDISAGDERMALHEERRESSVI